MLLSFAHVNNFVFVIFASLWGIAPHLFSLLCSTFQSVLLRFLQVKISQVNPPGGRKNRSICTADLGWPGTLPVAENMVSWAQTNPRVSRVRRLSRLALPRGSSKNCSRIAAGAAAGMTWPRRPGTSKPTVRVYIRLFSFNQYPPGFPPLDRHPNLGPLDFLDFDYSLNFTYFFGFWLHFTF